MGVFNSILKVFIRNLCALVINTLDDHYEETISYPMKKKKFKKRTKNILCTARLVTTNNCDVSYQYYYLYNNDNKTSALNHKTFKIHVYK